MTAAVRAADTPFAVEVAPGKEYFWCACGLSKNQPFCDGAHKATDITPMKYTTNQKKTAYFCGCKATKNRPLCDGTHKKV
jgi:CDGSH-type Zn-finger protein